MDKQVEITSTISKNRIQNQKESQKESQKGRPETRKIRSAENVRRKERRIFYLKNKILRVNNSFKKKSMKKNIYIMTSIYQY